MTEGSDLPPFGSERDGPGTRTRTGAEADDETLRIAGGDFAKAVARTRMPMAVIDTRLPGTPIIFANDAFVRLSGYSLEEVLGQQHDFLNGPATDVADANRFREALDRGEDAVIEIVQHRKDGSPFCAAVFGSPVTDERGAVIRHFLSCLDITARVEAEQRDRAHAAELERRIAERTLALDDSEERLRLIVENARDYAIFTIDLDARVTDWREGAEIVFGFSREEMIGRDGDILFTPEDRAAGEPEKERAIAAATGKAPNVRWHVCKDGQRVFIDGVCTALHDAGGRLIGYLKVGRNATERHTAEQRQKLLLGELQHRVRNTLGVVRSIARRTAENSESVEELSAHFEGRLDAFARVQAIVTRRPEGGVDFSTLIEDELLAHAAHEGDAVSLNGPAVAFATRPAETMSLALHELATNAVKYGALGAVHGRIAIQWSLADGRFEFSWAESGVPDPPLRPTREGFGMELLRRVIPYEMSAETGIEFRPDGLRFTLSMPAEGNIGSL